MNNLFLKELGSFTDTCGNVFSPYEGFNRSVRYVTNGIEYNPEKDIFYDYYGNQISLQIKTYFKLVFCFHDDLVITPLSFNNLYEDYFEINDFWGNFIDNDGKEYQFQIHYTSGKVAIFYKDSVEQIAERNFIFQTID